MKIYNFPYSALLLYSKGWISFTQKHPDWDIFKQISYVVNMCGYIPMKNAVFQILLIFDHILQFIELYNSEHSEGNQIRISNAVTSIYGFENEVYRYMQLYDCNHDEAMIRVICSELSMIKIPDDIAVKEIDYNTKDFNIGGEFCKQGTTKTYQNQVFRKKWQNLYK